MDDRKINLEQLEKDSFSKTLLDGLNEVFMGVALLVMAIMLENTPTMGLMAVVIVFSPKIVERIKEKQVYPRIGFVSVKKDAHPKTIQEKITTFVFILVGISLLTLIVIAEVLEVDFSINFTPLLFGILMVGPSLTLVKKSGKKIYYGMGLFEVILGVILMLAITLDEPLEVLMVMMFISGIFWLIFGLIKFNLFKKKYPIQEEPDIEILNTKEEENDQNGNIDE